MSIITAILPQKRSANRRSVHLDGAFAFGCNLNVIAKFRLRPGLALTPIQIEEIQTGEVAQECFDSAIRFLETRLHGRIEIKRKLMRKEWGESIIEQTLDNLQRLGYLDDLRFAITKANAAAKHKHHGRRRVYVELLRAGIARDIAENALAEVFTGNDSTAIVRRLIEKQQTRLQRLEPSVARRRVVGMLQRRGFDYTEVSGIVDETLGRQAEDRDE